LKASQERLDKINLLQARVDTLEQDNSILREKTHKLQEKKRNHFSLDLVVVAVFLQYLSFVLTVILYFHRA